MVEKKIEEFYCNKDVGTCLYSDNLLCIERVNLIADMFRLYAKNERVDEEFIKLLDEFKRKGAFYSLKKIEDLGYTKDFINFLYSCQISQKYTQGFSIKNGIFSKGYLEKTYNLTYSKDLRPCIEMTLVNRDILVPVICFNNKIYKNLSYNSASFINKISLKERNLMIGLDSGYLIYLNKLKNNKIYIYESDKEYVNFFKENILKHIDTSLEIVFLDSLEEKIIDNLNIDNIILNNSVDIDINLKYFIELKLYNYLEILNVDNLTVYLNKLKLDLRDIVMSGEKLFKEVLLENFKDFKGIDSAFLSAELDFTDKCAKFLNDNNIFYTSYKKIQKDLNNDNFLFNILKNY